MKDLAKSVSLIMRNEGAKPTISSNEPGGISTYGLSLEYMQEIKPGFTFEQVKNITKDFATEIYTNYVAPSIRFNDLPAGVDYRLFDIRTNLGLKGGIETLEKALARFPITGLLSDSLIAEANAISPLALIHALSASWITKKYENINWHPSPITKHGYGEGWSNRNKEATGNALSFLGVAT